MAERRQSERHQLMFHAEVIDAETDTRVGQLLDISATGLMLAAEVPIEVDRRYRLRIPLPIPFDGYSELRLRVTAAWAAESLHPAFLRTGFRDLELAPEQQRAFERLIDEYRLRAAAE